MRLLVIALLSATWLGRASPASAAPVHCTDGTYDAAAKASVASLLEARYGDAYKAFDLDRASLVLGLSAGDVVETARGRERIDLRRVGWRGFERVRPAPAGVPKEITVAFDHCSGKAVGFSIWE